MVTPVFLRLGEAGPTGDQPDRATSACPCACRRIFNPKGARPAVRPSHAGMTASRSGKLVQIHQNGGKPTRASYRCRGITTSAQSWDKRLISVARLTARQLATSEEISCLFTGASGATRWPVDRLLYSAGIPTYRHTCKMIAESTLHASSALRKRGRA